MSAALDEIELERRLYPTVTTLIVRKQRPLLDWRQQHRAGEKVFVDFATASH